MSRAIDIIKASNDQIAKASAPDILRQRFAGEIDFAFKFGLISYAERDQMLSMQATTCKDRRAELHAEKLTRLGISQ